MSNKAPSTYSYQPENSTTCKRSEYRFSIGKMIIDKVKKPRRRKIILLYE